MIHSALFEVILRILWLRHNRQLYKICYSAALEIVRAVFYLLTYQRGMTDFHLMALYVIPKTFNYNVISITVLKSG